MEKIKNYNLFKIVSVAISCCMLMFFITACSQIRSVVAKYSDIELSVLMNEPTLLSVGAKIVIDGGSSATAITYQFTGLEEKTTETETGAVNVDITPNSPIKNIYELKAKAVYGNIASEEKTYYIMIKGVTAKYDGVELSQNSEEATKVAVGSKLALDGGSQATAITYQFTGLDEKTTPTGTGAVNVNIDPESSIGKHTLNAKAVYGDGTSEEKTYYLMLEDKFLTATYNKEELSQDSTSATKITAGSKFVLDGGRSATAIIYQFIGLEEKTTETETGAVNVNIDTASAIGVEHTLKVKAVYENETSEEKTYYLIIE